MSSGKKAENYGSLTTISIVIANMVGTGVFTSLGFQLLQIESGFAIIALWAAGGLAAFCGAISYAELGAALPRSGGEYHFIGRIFHPAAGFVSGWASATVGFAAPSALAAMTFAAYGAPAVLSDPSDGIKKLAAIALIVLLAIVHASKRSLSGGAQALFTLFKVAVIIAFCAAVFLNADGGQTVRFAPSIDDLSIMTSSGFAISLIYVSFAFTGWNAATYFIDEIRSAQITLPIILGLGTFIVAALYILLNISFLIAAPIEILAGEVEVGVIAAEYHFGERAGALIGAVMALLLVSTVSAMTIAGPRVIYRIGQDFPSLRGLAKTSNDGIPRRAIMLQSALAIIFILTSSFESILVFAGSLVALNSFCVVAGLFALRAREPNLHRPYRAFLFPVTSMIYLAVTGWALYFTLTSRIQEALFVAGVIVSGLAVYMLARLTGARRITR